MSPEPTIVFVCEHGAAKSVIAAAYLPRLAAARGLAMQGIARGTDPEPSLSPVAVRGLEAAGLSVPLGRPERVTAEEVATAAMVVSFGPDVGDLVPEGVPQLRWADVPAVSDGFAPARDAIVSELQDLLGRLYGPRGAGSVSPVS